MGAACWNNNEMKTVDGLSESPARRRRPLSSRLSADRFIATVHAAASLSLSLSLSLCLSVCLSVFISTIFHLIPPYCASFHRILLAIFHLIPPHCASFHRILLAIFHLIPPYCASFHRILLAIPPHCHPKRFRFRPAAVFF